MTAHITDWFARQAFDSLWALVWHFGIVAGILILALAWAWFMPIGKKGALVVALCAAVILITASIYTKLGADYVQAKWNASLKADAKAAISARTRAEARVPRIAPGVAHAPRLRWDSYDRDNWRQPGVPPHNVFELY